MPKLTITFPDMPDMPPQFPAIGACELVIEAMQDPKNGNGGTIQDGNGGEIVWALEP